jgi:iron complex transport system permease protein
VTPRRPAALLLACGVFAAACALVAVTLGPARVGVGEVLAVLVGADASPLARDVVLLHRLPRIELGLAVGAALAASGALFQAVLRNPLADPYLVGVGPGAFLGSTVGVALGLSTAQALGLSAVALCAFAGALGAAALVLVVAGRSGRFESGRLLLCGVAVGSFVTAVATGALYLASESWHHVVGWLLGRLAWADSSHVAFAATATALLLGVAWWRARDLDALTLGEDAARLVGVDPARTVRDLSVVGCLLAATAVATAGLIGFVGLVVPHLARRVVGAGHRLLLPASALLGAGLLVVADGLARLAMEVPVGVVTALLGAPVFAWIVARR